MTRWESTAIIMAVLSFVLAALLLSYHFSGTGSESDSCARECRPRPGVLLLDSRGRLRCICEGGD